MPKELKQRMQDYFQTVWSLNHGIDIHEVRLRALWWSVFKTGKFNLVWRHSRSFPKSCAGMFLCIFTEKSYNCRYSKRLRRDAWSCCRCISKRISALLGNIWYIKATLSLTFITFVMEAWKSCRIIWLWLFSVSVARKSSSLCIQISLEQLLEGTRFSNFTPSSENVNKPHTNLLATTWSWKLNCWRQNACTETFS